MPLTFQAVANLMEQALGVLAQGDDAGIDGREVGGGPGDGRVFVLDRGSQDHPHVVAHRGWCLVGAACEQDGEDQGLHSVTPVFLATQRSV